jgi:soluble lytic murein transglycosylase-like protein
MPEDYTNYTVNYPHQAAWLVYMNGLEIPVTSVYVDFGVNKIPTCTIEMPPDPRLTRLGFEDRVEVVVFYLDEFFDPNDPQFCLMGEFDLMGWGYSNSGTGRSLRFLCVGTVQIFEMLNMFYISAVDDIVTAYLPDTVTDASVLQQAMVYFPASLFMQGFMPQQRPLTDTEGETEVVPSDAFIKTPYQFIRNVFRSLLAPVDVTQADPNAVSDAATQVPQSASSAPGRNFFARYLKRRDVYRRFVGLPFIDDELINADEGCFPIIKAARSTSTLTAIQSQLGASIGPQGNIWELMRSVLGTMLMEVVSIPAPCVGMIDKDKGVIVDLFEGKRNKGNLVGAIAANCIKPQCYFGLPPRCNIIFPSMVESLSLDEDYTEQPTRVYVGETFLANQIASKANGNAAALVNSTLTTGYPPIVKSRMRQYVLSSNQNTKNFLIWPEEFYRGPVAKHTSAPPWLWLLDAFRKSLEGDATAGGGAGGHYMTMGAKKMRKLIEPYVNNASTKYSVPKYWILSTIYKESGFQAVNDGRIVSPKGQISRGLMQVNTNHFPRLVKKLEKEGMLPKGMTVDSYDYNDPELNVLVGTRLAKEVIDELDINPANLTRANLIFYPDAPINDMHVFVVGYAGGVGAARKEVKPKKDQGKKLGDLSWGPYDNPGRRDKSKPGEGWGRFLRRAVNRMAEGWDSMVSSDQQASGGEDPNQQVSAQDATDELIAEAQENGEYGSNTPSDDPTYNKPPEKKAPDPATTQQTSEDTKGYWGSASQGAYESSKQAIADDKAKDGVSDTAQSIDTAVGEMSAMDQGALGVLFDYYAQYEYYRSRYEKRVGAAILAFNPYIVPAFPTVVFDSKYSGISTIGYVMNVRHQMSAQAGAPAMKTTVNTAFQRTLPEFLGDMKTGWDYAYFLDKPFPYSCFPIEPIPDVAHIFQELTVANDFYGKFFYNDRLNIPIPENTAEMDRKDEEEIQNQESNPEDVSVFEEQTTFDADVAVATTRRDNMRAVKGSAYAFNLHNMLRLGRKAPSGEFTDLDLPFWDFTEDMEVMPSPTYSEHFRSYDTAMGYVARPVCTLRQYISLKHGMSVEDAISKGYVKGEETSFFSRLKSKTGGALFWARIYTLRPGPGDVDDEKLQRYANSGPAPDYAPMTKWDMISTGGLPQTRRDWDSVLLAYRNTVRAQGGDRGVPRR